MPRHIRRAKIDIDSQYTKYASFIVTIPSFIVDDNQDLTDLMARIFEKNLSDITPKDFIRLMRLRKAAKYLTQGEYKINEICYLVGFESPSYFARCFYNQFGILPKDFNSTKHTHQNNPS